MTAPLANRQIVLDTETTGLSAHGGDRIIEIGCVELIDRRLTGKNLSIFVNPERSSTQEALRIHGINDEFLKDKPKFGEIVDELLEFLQGSELIIHNAAFDLGFLDMELSRINRPPMSELFTSIIDSLALAKEIYPGKRNSLDALCERLGIDNSKRTLHGARLDAELLAEVYLRLTQGQESLLIDLEESSAQQDSGSQMVDLCSFDLPVLAANAQELSHHEAVLADIDKQSNGKTIWRRLQA